MRVFEVPPSPFNIRYAHTAPSYITVAGAQRRSAAAAAFLSQWMSEYIALFQARQRSEASGPARNYLAPLALYRRAKAVYDGMALYRRAKTVY